MPLSASEFQKAEIGQVSWEVLNGFGSCNSNNSNFPLSILVVDVSLSIMSFHFLLCVVTIIIRSERLAKPKGKRLIMDSFMSETESVPLPITSQEVKLVL